MRNRSTPPAEVWLSSASPHSKTQFGTSIADNGSVHSTGIVRAGRHRLERLPRAQRGKRAGQPFEIEDNLFVRVRPSSSAVCRSCCAFADFPSGSACLSAEKCKRFLVEFRNALIDGRMRAGFEDNKFAAADARLHGLGEAGRRDEVVAAEGDLGRGRDLAELVLRRRARSPRLTGG